MRSYWSRPGINRRGRRLKNPSRTHIQLELEKIRDIVLKYLCISQDDFYRGCKERNYVYARQLAYYFMHNCLLSRHDLNGYHIISHLSDRHHSTVIYGIRRVKELLEVNGDSKLTEDVQKLKNNLKWIYETTS